MHAVLQQTPCKGSLLVVQAKAGLVDNAATKEVAKLALEYCAGGSLADWLHRNHQHLPPASVQSPCCVLSLEMRLLLIEQILMGLDHVNACDLVHMDLKPANILLRTALSGSDASTVDVAVGDLGLALAAGTLLQDPHGTAGFMPPEVALLSPTTPRRVHASMDIWSVGISLLELAGCHEVAAMTVPEVQESLQNGRVALHLQTALLTCEPEYARLCADCLKRRPEI
jgi:serine/threonine protein kinase